MIPDQLLEQVRGPWQPDDAGRLRLDGLCPVQAVAKLLDPRVPVTRAPDHLAWVFGRPLNGNEEVDVSETMLAADHPSDPNRAALEALICEPIPPTESDQCAASNGP